MWDFFGGAGSLNGGSQLIFEKKIGVLRIHESCFLRTPFPRSALFLLTSLWKSRRSHKITEGVWIKVIRNVYLKVTTLFPLDHEPATPVHAGSRGTLQSTRN